MDLIAFPPVLNETYLLKSVIQVILYNRPLYIKGLDCATVLGKLPSLNFLMWWKVILFMKSAIKPGDCSENLFTHAEGSSLCLLLSPLPIHGT